MGYISHVVHGISHPMQKESFCVVFSSVPKRFRYKFI